MLRWWIPAGQPPGEFLSRIGKYPGVPSLLAWGVVLVLTMTVVGWLVTY